MHPAQPAAGRRWRNRRTNTRAVKLSYYSPNFIEQTARFNHKPRAAWVYVRMLLNRRSAAGWAECMVTSPRSPHVIITTRLGPSTAHRQILNGHLKPVACSFFCKLARCAEFFWLLAPLISEWQVFPFLLSGPDIALSPAAEYRD